MHSLQTLFSILIRKGSGSFQKVWLEIERSNVMKKMFFIVCVIGSLLSMQIVQAGEEGVTVKVGEGSLTISGYAHLRYSILEDETGDANAIPSITANNAQDTFSNVRTRLILSGTVVPEVSYRIQYDLRADTKGLRDAIVKYSGLPHGLSIAGGQFKIPFSEAGLVWGTPANNLITGPIIYEGYKYKSAGLTAVTWSDRETGLILDGSLLEKKIGWAIGIVNGNGINQNDDNDQKDFLARVTLVPFEDENLKGLSFGIGAMAGEEAGSTYDERTRWTGTIKYDKMPFKVVGEYLFQERDRDAGGDEETDNWYITGSYTFTPSFLKEGQSFESILRYQQYEANSTVDYDDVDVITLGFNWAINKYVKLQLNYNYIDDDVDADDNEVLAQLELKF